MRARFISVDVRWWWFRWCYWAIVRPPRHCRLPVCIYHRLVRRGGVEHGVHVLNTAPMSTTSAATDIIRRVTGVAIISFNKPYRATPSRKSCRQHKLLGQSTRRCCTVECRFYTTTQSTVVHGGLCLSILSRAESMEDGCCKAARDSNWAKFSSNRPVLFLRRTPEALFAS